MDEERLRQTLMDAKAEIEEIDAKISSLGARRERLEAMVRATSGLLGSGRPSEALSEKRCGSPPPMITRSQDADLDAATATRMRSERRKYMQKIVDDTVSIIVSRGRPLTVDEILEVHPYRNHLDRNVLYHTLYKRVERKRHVMLVNAHFWPIDRELPESWDPRVSPSSDAKAPSRGRGRPRGPRRRSVSLADDQ